MISVLRSFRRRHIWLLCGLSANRHQRSRWAFFDLCLKSGQNPRSIVSLLNLHRRVHCFFLDDLLHESHRRYLFERTCERMDQKVEVVAFHVSRKHYYGASSLVTCVAFHRELEVRNLSFEIPIEILGYQLGLTRFVLLCWVVFAVRGSFSLASKPQALHASIEPFVRPFLSSQCRALSLTWLASDYQQIQLGKEHWVTR
mmetsp:Transcript_10847/g.22531  ORF Transcript_10847/g.22531 Transcript_10847/m.22531 type:complete len:200 (-) Transcript_10847:224-823(-)